MSAGAAADLAFVAAHRTLCAMRGTVRKLGLEGGLWALVTDEGDSIELIDAPPELLQNGMRAEIEGTREGAEVSIGMVGDAVRVTRWRKLG